MATRLRIIAVATIALLLAGLVGGSLWAWFAWRTTPGDAPAFSLESTGYENHTLGPSVPFSLEDYRGQTVLLDFMAVSCASCRLVTETVVRPIHETFAGRDDFEVISVDVWAGAIGETREDLVRLQQEENTTWRHALDTDGVLAKYGAIGIPYLAVVDPAGRLVFVQDGLPQRSDVEDAVRLAMTGQAPAQAILQVGTVGLSLLAGMAALFTPCAVGLMPGYVGQLMRTVPADRAGARFLFPRPIRAGVATAAGAVALYALMAVLLWAFGPFLRANLERVGPWMALGLMLVGVGMVFAFDWSRFVPSRWKDRSGQPSSFVAFGFAYGLVSFGCTGPVFLPILGAAFLQGTLAGVLAFVAYTASLAGVLLVVAVIVSSGSRVKPLHAVLAKARPIQAVAGILMVIAGGYLLWFYERAGLSPL